MAGASIFLSGEGVENILRVKNSELQILNSKCNLLSEHYNKSLVAYQGKNIWQNLLIIILSFNHYSPRDTGLHS